VLALATVGLMAQPGPPERVKVLIGFNEQPGASEEALVRALGGTVKHTYRLIPALAATVPQSAIAGLSNHPAVSVIEPDARIFALGRDEYDSTWGVKKINAATVHDGGNRGAGIKVCVIDTGIDKTHPDLYLNYAGGYNFVTPGSEPIDDNGHGTHVAGTIVAMANGLGVIGVAPQARILAYKILDAEGYGYIGDATAALERCMADGGQISNHCYGSIGDPGEQARAVFALAANAGILHVGAAGNAESTATCNTVFYPAAYDSVVAVGATDSRDKAACFSCRGAELELAAPGVSIPSTYPGSAYGTGDGTSMAAPHVAGLAALIFGCGLVDQNGDNLVDNADVRLRMQQTALDLGTAGRDTTFGFGRIRADVAAMNCTAAPPPAAIPDAPTGVRASGSTRTTVSLGWVDESDNETNFVVERCTGAGCGDFAVVATLPRGTSTYTSSGMRRLTTYGFRVKAINSAGSSAWSSTEASTTK
jgi:subtilisin family serine protease